MLDAVASDPADAPVTMECTVSFTMGVDPMVAVLLASALIAANPGQETRQLSPAQARVVDSWLQSHPGYRLASDEDCGDCARQINAIRTGTGGRWTPVTDYHPYCTEGDFSGDKIKDLAVVVVAPGQVAKRFVVLVFNGPFASSGSHPPAFVSEPMDLTGSGLFFGPPRPRPYRLLVGGFESEGKLLIPKGKGYVWDQASHD